MTYHRNKFPDIPPDLTDWPEHVEPGSDTAVRAAEGELFGVNSSTLTAVVLTIVGMVILAFACYGCYEGGKAVWHAYLLLSCGVPANARVTAYTPKTMRISVGRGGRNVTVHVHTVTFDGHVGSVNLYKEVAVGTEISVLHLPESPQVVVAGTAEESFHALLFGQDVDCNELILFCLLVACMLCILGAWIRRLLVSWCWASCNRTQVDATATNP